MAYSCRWTLTLLASVTALRQSTRRDLGAWTAGALLVPARAVAALPSADRVPLFVITTADGSTPLFTDADGTRASFFAERRDAEAKLKSLKGAGDATVMSLPLSEALDLKKQPASELGESSPFPPGKASATTRRPSRARRPTPTTCPCSSTRASPHRPARSTSSWETDKSWAKAVGGKPSAKTGYPAYQTTVVRARSRGASRAAGIIVQ